MVVHCNATDEMSYAKKLRANNLSSDETLKLLRRDYEARTGTTVSQSREKLIAESQVKQQLSTDTPNDLSSQISELSDQIRLRKLAKKAIHEINQDLRKLEGLKDKFKTIAGFYWASGYGSKLSTEPKSRLAETSKLLPQNIHQNTNLQRKDRAIRERAAEIRNMKMSCKDEATIRKEAEELGKMKQDFLAETGVYWSPKLMLSSELDDAFSFGPAKRLQVQEDFSEMLVCQSKRLQEIQATYPPGSKEVAAEKEILTFIMRGYHNVAGKKWQPSTRDGLANSSGSGFTETILSYSYIEKQMWENIMIQSKFVQFCESSTQKLEHTIKSQRDLLKMLMAQYQHQFKQQWSEDKPGLPLKLDEVALSCQIQLLEKQISNAKHTGKGNDEDQIILKALKTKFTEITTAQWTPEIGAWLASPRGQVRDYIADQRITINSA